MRKFLGTALVVALSAACLAGCGGNSGSDGSTGSGSAGNGGAITVLSREDGSGTRGAFIELFGIEQENESGKKLI